MEAVRPVLPELPRLGCQAVAPPFVLCGELGTHVLASELQQTVYAMTSRRGIDLLASADTGQVWGSQDFSSRNWESGIGGGLQYRHSRNMAARVEASRSRERIAIYASLSRGF